MLIAVIATLWSDRDRCAPYGFRSMLGPPIAGWLFDAHGDYVYAAVFSCSTLVLAM